MQCPAKDHGTWKQVTGDAGQHFIAAPGEKDYQKGVAGDTALRVRPVVVETPSPAESEGVVLVPPPPKARAQAESKGPEVSYWWRGGSSKMHRV